MKVVTDEQKKKRAAYQREYHKSAKWLAYRKQAMQTERYKSGRRAYMKRYSITEHGKEISRTYRKSHREQYNRLRKKWYQKHKDEIFLKAAIKKRNRIEQEIKDPAICFKVRAICRAIHGGDETMGSIKMYNRIMGIVIREYKKIV